MKKRIAFTLIGGKSWTGGRHYLLNLLRALTKHQSHRIAPVVFMGDYAGSDDAELESIPGVEIVRTSMMDPGRGLRSLLLAGLLGRDPKLKKLFEYYGVDVVFEAAQFHGWRLGVPAIAWMPDFQHRELPDMFSHKAWWKREIGLRAQIMTGRMIMVSSEDAQKVCEHYYLGSRGKIRIVRFAVPPPEGVSPEEARKVANSYGLPDHFFFMPNQFWRHKNHMMVLEALVTLREKGKRVVIAASGRQEDMRNPSHFPAFLSRLREQGLQNMFRILGMIPYRHVSLLMRASSALLNPSLFEGWSTTVEEAKSSGTPLILSNIDVHREQAGDSAIYFDRHSPHSLATVLESFRPLKELEREARVKTAACIAEERVARFAEEFSDLVCSAASSGAGK